MKKILLLWLCISISACSPAKNDSEAQAPDYSPYKMSVESRVSDKVLTLNIPKCFYFNSQKLPQTNEMVISSTITMEFPRLSFSQADFNTNFECQRSDDKISPYSARLSAISPDTFALGQEDIYAYLLTSQRQVGGVYLDKKNSMWLYKVSPVSNGIFFDKKFPSVQHPISITFIAFDYKNPNSSFRYYFDVSTIIHNEFELSYTVVATASDPDQFAERFRQLIEEDGSILDHPEIIEQFVLNNEKIAAYFEQHSVLTTR